MVARHSAAFGLTAPLSTRTTEQWCAVKFAVSASAYSHKHFQTTPTLATTGHHLYPWVYFLKPLHDVSGVLKNTSYLAYLTAGATWNRHDIKVSAAITSVQHTTTDGQVEPRFKRRRLERRHERHGFHQAPSSKGQRGAQSVPPRLAGKETTDAIHPSLSLK
jgi:hypothetical protein